MALIGNYSLINRTPIRQFATGVSSGYAACITPPSAVKNRFFGGFAKTSATPNGYLAPSAWVLPMLAGGMSSHNTSPTSITSSVADLLAGKTMIASSSISLSVLSATLDKVIAMIASGNISVSGTIALSAAINAYANGTISLSALSVVLGGIIPIAASSSVSVAPSVIMTATASMEASAGGPTPLSPEGLAASLLNSILADYNSAGSVGEALNNVGAAGNPWDATLASNNTAGTFGEQVQKLLTLAKYLGLR